MPAVLHDETVGRQQVVEAASDRAGVEQSIGRDRVADRWLGALADDPARVGRLRREFEQGADGGRGIPAHVQVDAGVGRRGFVVDLDDRRGFAEQLAERGRELVERRPHDEHDIGLGDPLPARGCREAPRDPEIPLAALAVAVREHARAERRRGHEGIDALGEGPQVVAGAGDPRAAPGEDERALGPRELADDPVHRRG